MEIFLSSLRTAELAHTTSVTLCNLSEMISFFQSHLHPVENNTVNPLSSVQASHRFGYSSKEACEISLGALMWLDAICHRSRMVPVVDHAARDNSAHLGQEILAIAKMPKLPTVMIYLLLEKESKLTRENL